ncbi:MAG: type II toxin-antitoxin system prevent-host-death family antitoxin [Candidatus Daviesbacteria bacterium]|nr:type II toxin-antitoxin system prevent-host-death family antitoxin [Candidatus Daviesbacteria bacterium]
MSTITVSATSARNNFFELLNQVVLGTQVIIERDSKEVAILSSNKPKLDLMALRKATKETHGILKNYKFDPEDNPLRRKGAADFLGKWDKQSFPSLRKGKGIRFK